MGGKTSNESKAKYNAKAYDRINVIVRKDGGVTKQTIKEHAERMNTSINNFILRAVTEAMERDKSGD